MFDFSCMTSPWMTSRCSPAAAKSRHSMATSALSAPPATKAASALEILSGSAISIMSILLRQSRFAVSTRMLSTARHDHVHDMHQHGLVVLVQRSRPELDEALLRTGL